MEKDTISLLKECDAGTKMAVSSLDAVLDNVCDSKLKHLLIESKNHHEKLKADIHEELKSRQSEEKEPSAMAKSMSWMKTNMKLTMNEADSTIADLLTDGCNMGIKSLHKYQNQYRAADHTSKDICNRLIDIEEQLCKDLQHYL